MLKLRKELFSDVLLELLHHKLRTLLTLLGMIFGVGAVIAMLSIGEGAEQEALEMIDSMGLRNIIVETKLMDEQALKESREKSAGLSIRDMEIVHNVFPFVESSGAQKKVKTYAVFSQAGKSDAIVSAVTPSFLSLSNFKTASGSLLEDEHSKNYEQVAVLGSSVVQQLFPHQEPIGQFVKINHLWFKVVGVLENRNLDKAEIEGVKLGTENNQIFIPLSTARKKLKFEPLESELDSIKFKIEKGTDLYAAAKIISDQIRKRHSNEDDFSLIIPDELLKQQQQTQRIFTIVMSCVAGISLLVGGIGIMNIMLASVLERTKEIGLLRAVGACKRDIVIQFVIESFLIAAIGGVIGIFLGYGLALIITFYAAWNMAISIFAIILSVGVCALVGIGFGLYPAIKASRLDPIEALQRE